MENKGVVGKILESFQKEIEDFNSRNNSESLGVDDFLESVGYTNKNILQRLNKVEEAKKYEGVDNHFVVEKDNTNTLDELIDLWKRQGPAKSSPFITNVAQILNAKPDEYKLVEVPKYHNELKKVMGSDQFHIGNTQPLINALKSIFQLANPSAKRNIAEQIKSIIEGGEGGRTTAGRGVVPKKNTLLSQISMRAKEYLDADDAKSPGILEGIFGIFDKLTNHYQYSPKKNGKIRELFDLYEQKKGQIHT